MGGVDFPDRDGLRVPVKRDDSRAPKTLSGGFPEKRRMEGLRAVSFAVMP